MYPSPSYVPILPLELAASPNSSAVRYLQLQNKRSWIDSYKVVSFLKYILFQNEVCFLLLLGHRIDHFNLRPFRRVFSELFACPSFWEECSRFHSICFVCPVGWVALTNSSLKCWYNLARVIFHYYLKIWFWEIDMCKYSI